jgi:hypothetical protein
MSTYSPNLRLTLIGTGEQAGTWGTTTNNNYQYGLEQAVSGYLAKTVAAGTGNYISVLDGAQSSSADYPNTNYKLTGASGTYTLFLPPYEMSYTFWNSTSYVATISCATTANGTTASGGTTITIPAGYIATVFSDATNIVEKVNSIAGNLSVGGNAVFSGTGGVTLPVGTTAQQAGSTGTIRFNSSLTRYEGYNGSSWGSLGGSGATGGGNNLAFYENDITVTNSYTITAGKNAMSAGPITVATPFSGTATLTNGSGSAGNILNVATVTAGALYIGNVITGSGVPSNTIISSFGTGSGGVGTYIVSTSSGYIAAPTSMTSTIVVTVPSGSKWTVVG